MPEYRPGPLTLTAIAMNAIPPMDAAADAEQKSVNEERGSQILSNTLYEDGRPLTDEESVCLRLVPGKIPWAAYIVSFAEFAERASYFGCVTVFTNFIQRPLPEGGNSAGAPPGGTQLNAGALGLGLITATAVVQTFSFLVMALPICGGMLADAKWGLYRSIWIGTGIAFAAHIIMVTASVPAVIASGYAIAPFAISVVLLAFGTACIKPCIIPLIVQQSPVRRQYVKTLKVGSRSSSTRESRCGVWYTYAHGR